MQNQDATYQEQGSEGQTATSSLQPQADESQEMRNWLDDDTADADDDEEQPFESAHPSDFDCCRQPAATARRTRPALGITISTAAADLAFDAPPAADDAVVLLKTQELFEQLTSPSNNAELQKRSDGSRPHSKVILKTFAIIRDQ
jgi:hypothetical protein